jgi:hypothetical protein
MLDRNLKDDFGFQWIDLWNRDINYGYAEEDDHGYED